MLTSLGTCLVLLHAKQLISDLDHFAKYIINWVLVQYRCKNSDVATSIYFHNVSYRYGVDDSSSFLMSNVDCSTSDYLVILQCSYYSYVPSSCEQNSDEVSVNCCKLYYINFMFY